MIEVLTAPGVGIAAGVIGTLGGLSSYFDRSWGRRRMWLWLTAFNAFLLVTRVALSIHGR